MLSDWTKLCIPKQTHTWRHLTKVVKVVDISLSFEYLKNLKIRVIYVPQVYSSSFLAVYSQMRGRAVQRDAHRSKFSEDFWALGQNRQESSRTVQKLGRALRYIYMCVCVCSLLRRLPPIGWHNGRVGTVAVVGRGWGVWLGAGFEAPCPRVGFGSSRWSPVTQGRSDARLSH